MQAKQLRWLTSKGLPLYSKPPAPSSPQSGFGEPAVQYGWQKGQRGIADCLAAAAGSPGAYPGCVRTQHWQGSQQHR